MPGRLSALMYSAVPKCRQGRSPKKVSTVAGIGKGATRFGPKGPATTGAVRERARRGLTNFAMKIRQKFVNNLTNEFVIRHF